MHLSMRHIKYKKDDIKLTASQLQSPKTNICPRALMRVSGLQSIAVHKAEAIEQCTSGWGNGGSTRQCDLAVLF